MPKIQIYPALVATVEGFRDAFRQNTYYTNAERAATRQELSATIQQAERDGQVQAFNFICTHNSRRSQIAQIWLTVAAAWFGNGFVSAHSGGTEVTALHPNVVTALRELGFRVERNEELPAQQLVYFSDAHAPIKCWSKLYNDPTSPQKNFLAIMVCDDADANCPVIPSASARISLRYIDPKFSDGTNEEPIVYQTTAREVGSEVFSLFA